MCDRKKLAREHGDFTEIFAQKFSQCKFGKFNYKITKFTLAFNPAITLSGGVLLLTFRSVVNLKTLRSQPTSQGQRAGAN